MRRVSFLGSTPQGFEKRESRECKYNGIVKPFNHKHSRPGGPHLISYNNRMGMIYGTDNGMGQNSFMRTLHRNIKRRK